METVSELEAFCWVSGTQACRESGKQEERGRAPERERERGEDGCPTELAGEGSDRRIVPEQLGLRERERGQPSAQGGHRWSLWMGSGETWSGISDGHVDDS
ncbi:unnamed protein product [Pleuronectes platessa]|uniref:Uncharacterized protein n=1 Tax=Pleuronectes platessa TaxID=8262 RepID=A0A9N7Y692_PLEPL|nr:unnamed protein product [Pleuronectes platessa]